MTKKLFFSLSLKICLVVLIFTNYSLADTTYNVQTLNLQTNDLVYSPKNRLLYASVPSTVATYGNYVVAINPFTKQIVKSVFVGSEPNKLALSGDEDVLYVGLDGAASVRKVLLDNFTADIQFSLGGNSNGQFRAEDIVVLPKNPNIIAVSRRNTCCSPRHEGVAIYENGIVKSQTTNKFIISNAIETNETGDLLFGYDAEASDFSFQRLQVTENGVVIQDSLQGLIQGYNVDIRYLSGRLFTSNGSVVDPYNRTLLGTFAVANDFPKGFSVDAKSNRAFFINNENSSVVIKGFNTKTYQFIGQITMPQGFGAGSRIVRWGRRGLVFQTDNGKIIFLETSLIPAQPNVSDFDGDELADYAVFRRDGGIWFTNSTVFAYPFGISTDIPVAGDYDGDNKTDYAVYRNGMWYVLYSSNQTFVAFPFGSPTDKPVPADYDGDQKTDFAVYRDGIWYINRSSDGRIEAFQFGLPTDKPVPADFDGDGKADYAVFRPQGGIWYIFESNLQRFRAMQFGIDSAQPVAADFDGDGLADISVFQNVFGQPAWYIFQSKDNQLKAYPFAVSDNSIAFPADYDGDGKADPTVFSSSGLWTRKNSSNGQEVVFQFGQANDLPITSKLF